MYRTDKAFMKNPATAHLRIYVGSVADSVLPEDLEKKFSVHGPIQGLVLQKGFGFIQFETEEQAQAAINKEHGTNMQGRKLNVRPIMDAKKPGPQQQANAPPPQQQPKENPPPQASPGKAAEGEDKAEETPQEEQDMETDPPAEEPPFMEPNKRPWENRENRENRDNRNDDRNNRDGRDSRNNRGNRGNRDSMNRDDMNRDNMSRDNMNRDNMNRDNMNRDNMNRDNMNRDNMNRDNMNRDNMNRDNMNRDNMNRDNMNRGNMNRDMKRDSMNRDNMNRDMNRDNMDGRDHRDNWDNRDNRENWDNRDNREWDNRGNFPPPDRMGPPPHHGRFNREPFYPPMDDYMPRFEPPPVVPERERNDCEIIVVSKILTEYAEYIEQRLKTMGLIVDLLFPNEDVPIGRVLANISSRGCLYAILVMPQNEEMRSLTLNILHGIPQEHRNMPIEDALILMSRNFEAYMRGDKTLAAAGSLTVTDRHPEAMQLLINLIAENRQITTAQYDKLLKYLNERRELQATFEGTEGDKPPPPEGVKAAELQNRILNILNKSAEDPPKPVLSQPPPSSGPQSTPLLNDPSVQKALDSLLLGDMFKSISTGGF